MPKIIGSAVPLLLLTAFPAFASDRGQNAAASSAPAPELSRRQIHAYASALLEIQKMKQMASARAAKLQPADAALLKNRVQAEMMSVLQKHGLDVASFNAISGRIEQHRRLRHQVKQLMMEELLST